VLLKVVLFRVEFIFTVAEILTGLVDQLIPPPGIFNGFLPLEVKLMTLLVQALELFRCLIKLNLCSLSLCDLLLKLSTFVAHLNRQLLNLQS
jgi:hypothetical protein